MCGIRRQQLGPGLCSADFDSRREKLKQEKKKKTNSTTPVVKVRCWGGEGDPSFLVRRRKTVLGSL